MFWFVVCHSLIHITLFKLWSIAKSSWFERTSNIKMWWAVIWVFSICTIMFLSRESNNRRNPLKYNAHSLCKIELPRDRESKRDQSYSMHCHYWPHSSSLTFVNSLRLVSMTQTIIWSCWNNQIPFLIFVAIYITDNCVHGGVSFM